MFLQLTIKLAFAVENKIVYVYVYVYVGFMLGN